MAVGIRAVQAKAQHSNGGTARRRVHRGKIRRDVFHRLAGCIQFFQVEGSGLYQVGRDDLKPFAVILRIDVIHHHVGPGVRNNASRWWGQHGKHRGGNRDVGLPVGRIDADDNRCGISRQRFEVWRVHIDDIARHALGSNIDGKSYVFGRNRLAGNDLSF